jgi:hypothetical protein
LPEAVAAAIESGDLVCCSVLSGNRNFEGFSLSLSLSLSFMDRYTQPPHAIFSSKVTQKLIQ